jgi:HKD family nuclease
MNKIINTIKKSKLLVFIVAFVTGGILTMIFLPEKIKVEEKELIKAKLITNNLAF